MNNILSEIQLAARLGKERHEVMKLRREGHIKPFQTVGEGNGKRYFYDYRQVVKRLERVRNSLAKITQV